jgi:hypothetical protein
LVALSNPKITAQTPIASCSGRFRRHQEDDPQPAVAELGDLEDRRRLEALMGLWV